MSDRNSTDQHAEVPDPHALHATAARHHDYLHLSPGIIAVGILIAFHVAALLFWLAALLYTNSRKATHAYRERRAKMH